MVSQKPILVKMVVGLPGYVYRFFAAFPGTNHEIQVRSNHSIGCFNQSHCKNLSKPYVPEGSFGDVSFPSTDYLELAWAHHLWTLPRSRSQKKIYSALVLHFQGCSPKPTFGKPTISIHIRRIDGKTLAVSWPEPVVMAQSYLIMIARVYHIIFWVYILQEVEAYNHSQKNVVM